MRISIHRFVVHHDYVVERFFAMTFNYEKHKCVLWSLYQYIFFNTKTSQNGFILDDKCSVIRSEIDVFYNTGIQISLVQYTAYKCVNVNEYFVNPTEDMRSLAKYWYSYNLIPQQL